MTWPLMTGAISARSSIEMARCGMCQCLFAPRPGGHPTGIGLPGITGELDLTGPECGRYSHHQLRSGRPVHSGTRTTNMHYSHASSASCRSLIADVSSGRPGPGAAVILYCPG